MAYMMQVRGRWWECSATLKMFRPHLLMFSRSYKRRIHSIMVLYKLDQNCTIYCSCNRWSVTYLREQVLQICFYAKTSRTAAAGQTRAMRDLPHPADLSHKLLLLLPPLPLPRFRSGRWDLQFILFIYRGRGFGLLLMRLLISTLAHSIHNNSHDFSDSLSKFKSQKKVWYYYKPPTKTFLPSSTIDATAKCSLLKITA